MNFDIIKTSKSKLIMGVVKSAVGLKRAEKLYEAAINSIFVKIPYSSTYLETKLEERRIRGILRSNINSYKSKLMQSEIIKQAHANPIQSLTLRELARGADNILLITSDHTRLLPSNITLPILLHEIRCSNRTAKIKILIATSYHRPTSYQEMICKFGKDIVEKEEISNHNSRD